MARIRRLFIILPVLTIALLACMDTYDAWKATQWDDTVLMTVNMLDVGQGDSIHLRDANGTDIVIDGGPGDAVLQELARTMPWSDRTIEYVLLTHPDADHVEGLVHVVERYQVQTVLSARNRSGTQVDNAFTDRWSGVEQIQTIQRGSQIEGDGWHLEVLWPLSNCISVQEREELNTHCEHDRNERSVVVKLTTVNDNRTTALFTGDIEREAETELLELYDEDVLRADILKVAHHGSTTSSYAPLIDMIQPLDVLISAGKDNSYGHPHQSTLNRFEERNATLWRTDTQGTVQCRIYKIEGYECRPLHLW